MRLYCQLCFPQYPLLSIPHVGIEWPNSMAVLILHLLLILWGKVQIFWERHKILSGRFFQILWPSQNIWTLLNINNFDCKLFTSDLPACFLYVHVGTCLVSTDCRNFFFCCWLSCIRLPRHPAVIKAAVDKLQSSDGWADSSSDT